jgi:adenylate kinase family enzyme
MRHALADRILILGNSGSGKSTLAAQIASVAACPHIPLDAIYWIDQRTLHKRGEAAARQITAARADEPAWVMEGVYGWLADIAMPRATEMIWLDLSWPDCKTGLETRGPSQSPSQAEYEALLVWAGQYWARQTASSHTGHQRIFDRFAGRKSALRQRADVAAFAASIGVDPATA